MTLDSSIYAFVGDFVDAGVDEVTDDLAAKGFASVSLATVYHAARDLLPHNPKRAVAHRTEGVHLGVHTRQIHDWTWGQAAVHLAGHTARRFGLVDRGLVRAGCAADICGRGLRRSAS